MKKPELIDAVASMTNESKKSTEATVNAVLKVIGEELKKGNTVELIGFGKFSTVDKAAREGINPLTKEKISIPKSIAPKFKPGKKLKELVNS